MTLQTAKSLCPSFQEPPPASRISGDVSVGHGFSYTETKFNEDKCVESSEKQSKFVPRNVREGVFVKHVVDDIGWKKQNI